MNDHTGHVGPDPLPELGARARELDYVTNYNAAASHKSLATVLLEALTSSQSALCPGAECL